ncbi:MAG: cell division protein ZapA [Bacteroidota bacterium]
MALISIRIKLADRDYPLNIDEIDEAMIREAAKAVNDGLKVYREKFRDSETQDLLALVAFDCMIEKQTAEFYKKETEKANTERANELSKLIDATLQDTQI